MFNWLKNDEAGQAMVEYGVILAVIAVVAMAGFKTLGGTINTKMGEINTALTT